MSDKRCSPIPLPPMDSTSCKSFGEAMEIADELANTQVSCKPSNRQQFIYFLPIIIFKLFLPDMSIYMFFTTNNFTTFYNQSKGRSIILIIVFIF